ncbi:hypothetical protein BH23THE1_BH23THE1_29740 [soil metagenome]
MLIIISLIFLTLANLQSYFDPPSAVDRLILDEAMNIDKDKPFSNNMAMAQEDDRKFISGFDTGSYPIGITINPISHKIYVANQYSNTVSVYDAKTDN